MGLTVELESDKVEQLAQDIVGRLVGDLEERVAELVSSKLQSILEDRYLVVPRQLTVKQVAYILQVPITRARALTTSGNIPRVKYAPDADGGSVRVDPRDLALWLDAHQEHPARREELKQIVAEGLILHA